jgi:HTH domain
LKLKLGANGRTRSCVYCRTVRRAVVASSRALERLAEPLPTTTLDDALREHREPWITKRELAEHLGISTRWIDRRIQMGLPSTLLGNRRRFQLSAVEA